MIGIEKNYKPPKNLNKLIQIKPKQLALMKKYINTV